VDFLKEPRSPGLRKKPGAARAATSPRTPPPTRAVATVNHYLKFLKALKFLEAVFNRAIRQGQLTYNPLSAVKLYRENNTRNRCLSPDEETRLVNALPERLRAFVTVALHTGMRRGELAALRWEDIDFATGTLRVKQDKAGDGQWVTLNSVAREALLSIKREQKVLGPNVFTSPQGQFLHNWDREWRPAVRVENLPDFRFHDCRHTFASRLAMAGVDLYTVQRAGSWKTQVMVQRYAHLSPDHMRAAVERPAQSAAGAHAAQGTAGEKPALEPTLKPALEGQGEGAGGRLSA
jgi:integrase